MGNIIKTIWFKNVDSMIANNRKLPNMARREWVMVRCPNLRFKYFEMGRKVFPMVDLV
ncbi:hypothetical protein OAG16_02765 [Saprospiraceae bacterium]|nr:hypothetical protein [Saprospiraceae bacterium]